MPWNESGIMSERIKFVGRLLDGEKMSDLCLEFGISRKTGYKIFSRYQADGLEGLLNQSRAPIRHPNQTTRDVTAKIIELRTIHPTWGAPKIKAYFENKFTTKAPASSTIHAILERANLIGKKRKRCITKSSGTKRTHPLQPNELWCADFKGQFRLKNGKYCYPLTITDRFSRYILCCEALDSTKEELTIPVMREVFKEYGVPNAILSDNGVPFGASSKFGLSALSIYCLRQGIELQRIKPGHPEENGSHERMHRTLKAEATKDPKGSLLAQQEVFDEWKEVFNHERPHQALEMKTPKDIYTASSKVFQEMLAPLTYPNHDFEVMVSKCGSIAKRNLFRVYIGAPFAGEMLGVKAIEDNLWQIDFMNYTLGFFDNEGQILQCARNPFLASLE